MGEAMPEQVRMYGFKAGLFGATSDHQVHRAIGQWTLRAKPERIGVGAGVSRTRP